jgi:hypothetical protein
VAAAEEDRLSFRRNSHTSFAAASDCRTIAIYECAPWLLPLRPFYRLAHVGLGHVPDPLAHPAQKRGGAGGNLSAPLPSMAM